jgi:hypothetical protein
MKVRCYARLNQHSYWLAESREARDDPCHHGVILQKKLPMHQNIKAVKVKKKLLTENHTVTMKYMVLYALGRNDLASIRHIFVYYRK